MTDRRREERCLACGAARNCVCHVESAIVWDLRNVAHKFVPSGSADPAQAQRISFAYGNANIENPNVTREMVEQEASRPEAASEAFKALCRAYGWTREDDFDFVLHEHMCGAFYRQGREDQKAGR